MSDPVALDRRQRFDVTRRLWDACAGCVTPDQVRELAARIYDDLLNGENDPLEIVQREVRDAGVPEARAPAVVSLILLVLHDRADSEIAALRRR
jgi:hypothetical protein